MLDTVLSDGVVLADDAIGSGVEEIATGEAEAISGLRDGDAAASDSGAPCGGESAIEGPDIPATESMDGETSEPNFDETVIIAENESSVDVTANLGAFSGLDKGAETNSESPNSKSEIRSRNPKFEARNPKSEIRNPKSEARSPKFEARNPKSEIRSSKSEIRSSKSEVQSSKSEIRSSKSEIRKSKSETASAEPEIENSGPPGLGLGGRVGGGWKRKASAKRERKRARREQVKIERERRLSKGLEEKACEAPAGESIGEAPESSPTMAEVVRRPLPAGAVTRLGALAGDWSRAGPNPVALLIRAREQGEGIADQSKSSESCAPSSQDWAVSPSSAWSSAERARGPDRWRHCRLPGGSA